MLFSANDLLLLQLTERCSWETAYPPVWDFGALLAFSLSRFFAVLLFVVLSRRCAFCWPLAVGSCVPVGISRCCSFSFIWFVGSSRCLSVSLEWLLPN